MPSSPRGNASPRGADPVQRMQGSSTLPSVWLQRFSTKFERVAHRRARIIRSGLRSAARHRALRVGARDGFVLEALVRGGRHDKGAVVRLMTGRREFRVSSSCRGRGRRRIRLLKPCEFLVRIRGLKNAHGDADAPLRRPSVSSPYDPCPAEAQKGGVESTPPRGDALIVRTADPSCAVEKRHEAGDHPPRLRRRDWPSGHFR